MLTFERTLRSRPRLGVRPPSERAVHSSMRCAPPASAARADATKSTQSSKTCIQFQTTLSASHTLRKQIEGISRHRTRGTALDAVQAAVQVVEDVPLFNSGRGAGFAADGTIEMDASIMNGQDLKGAVVASIHFTGHPVDLARAVMENTQYVLMVGSGAHAFSKAQGLEQEPQSFFFTEMRWKEFEQV